MYKQKRIHDNFLFRHTRAYLNTSPPQHLNLTKQNLLHCTTSLLIRFIHTYQTIDVFLSKNLLIQKNLAFRALVNDNNKR